MNVGIERAVGYGAKVVQKTQTGVTQSYLYVFGAGILFIVLFLFI
jgi:NADH-quinone oxidoreductase subunit L